MAAKIANMSRGSLQPNNGHYALLALIPPTAGFFVWQAVDHLAGLEYAWTTLGVGVLSGIATAVVWARRMRTSVAASLAFGGIVAGLALDVVLGLVTDTAWPARVVGFGEGFNAGLLMAGEVVLALWIHGNYRLEVGHRVSVWLLAGRTGDDPDYYQAHCECTWKSERFELEDGDDSEERVFEVAHQHSPTVRADVAVQL